MGDIKDIEDYKHKIEKQARLRRKTIKAVKAHFNIDDLEYLGKELLSTIEEAPLEPTPTEPTEVTITQSPQPENVFQPKIKTSVVARPLFKTKFERYEWHMQNGCISADDRKWLANYIASEEYKEIYGKE